MEFEINGEYIELVKLLKAAGVTDTGGEATIAIKSGAVAVNGEVDTRKKAKIRAGSTIICNNITIKTI